MKRLIAILMVLMLLGAGALAEGLQPLELGTEMSCDLDGDGAVERVSYAMVQPDGEYDQRLVVTVTPEAGDPVSYETEILWGGSVYLMQLDDGGPTDILASGDVMSDDYITWALRWKDGQLCTMLFPDGGRGDSQYGAYFGYGYGLFKEIGPNRLTLSGSQDMLGTWFGSRSYALTPLGYFEFADDGLWTRDIDEITDETWQYGALTLKTTLPYADLEGNPAGNLSAGEKILVTATDKQSRVWFTAQDGRTGTLAISPDYEKGWGWLVNGASEDDLFEYVPYAD